MEICRISAWEVQRKKEFSSQTSKIFKVLLIHVWTTSPLPPKSVPQIIKGISRITKGGISRSRFMWKLQSKPNCLDLVFVPGKSCLLLLSTEPSCLWNSESAHTYRGCEKESEIKQLPTSQSEGFVPLWPTVWTTRHVQENSRDHYLLGKRIAVPLCEGSQIHSTP